jgi:SAM-dependent methyltransferase
MSGAFTGWGQRSRRLCALAFERSNIPIIQGFQLAVIGPTVHVGWLERGHIVKVRESGMPEEALWATFFHPPAILERLLFERPTDVVEFGCGYGTFTLPAAQRTVGLVHAIELDPTMIEFTQTKAEAAGIANIRFIERDFVADGTGLLDDTADYAMLFNILHALDPMALLADAFRLLRPGGLIGAIHWNPSDTPRGPDLSIRPQPERIAAWINDTGFEIALLPTALPPYHYGLVGRKS